MTLLSYLYILFVINKKNLQGELIMKKTVQGLKSLFLATALALAPSAFAEEKAPEQTPAKPEAPQLAVAPIKTAFITKSLCPANSLQSLIDKRRVTLVFDIDPTVQQMNGFSQVLQGVVVEYAPKVKVPMEIIFLVPESPTDVSAPCWPEAIKDQGNVAIIYQGRGLAANKIGNDINPSSIDSILTLSSSIEMAQTIALKYIQSQQRAQNLTRKPVLSL